nr:MULTISPECIES: DUF29 family protein [Photorhabdus]
MRSGKPRRFLRRGAVTRSVFPETCPWTFEQIMDENFWPE